MNRWVLLLTLAGAAPTWAAAPDFDCRIMPVLTHAGCNTGACHGAAAGRGGFRLSLLGSNPDLDHERIVSEFEGRRVHLLDPDRSLLLRKPSGDLPHGGAVRLPADSPGYALLRDWLKAGAPRGTGRPLLALELTPDRPTLSAPGESFRVRAVARYADGAADVTPWVVFTPTDETALQVKPDATVTALRRGQHVLLARYRSAVGAVTVTVPFLAEMPKASRPTLNFVDDFVNRTLDRLHLPHAPRADDATLFRRVTLDLTGTLPDPAELDAYLADRDTDKFAKRVEKLLASEAFLDWWAYRWGDLLRIESRRLGPEGASAFHRWIRDRLADGTPLDRLARELILATGNGTTSGPANFSRVPADARAQAEYVSQVFLGVRLQCANCHDHPLDRWTQDDYHGLAAVFARVGRGAEVRLLDRGEVIHPRTGEPAVPRVPGVRFLPGKEDPRPALVEWLTARDNPFLARNAVNRVWQALMGRGLVEPVDDHRATNPPTHPELLAALARDLAGHDFDLRHTLRTIVYSEAYRRSSLPPEGAPEDDRFYSYSLVRPLAPVVVADAVAKVTGVAEKLGDRPEGTRAVTLGDSRVAAVPLDLLGRCSRDDGCGTTDAAQPLPLALHAINGPWLNAKIAAPAGRLQTLLRQQPDDAAVVETLYRVALSRSPNAAEAAYWKKTLAAADTAGRRERFEDLLWALLNTLEFRCNH